MRFSDKEALKKTSQPMDIEYILHSLWDTEEIADMPIEEDTGRCYAEVMPSEKVLQEIKDYAKAATVKSRFSCFLSSVWQN